MSAKLFVGGVEITVDVKELGEAMRQLAPLLGLPRALPPQPRNGSAPAVLPPTGAATPAGQKDGSTRQQVVNLLLLLKDYRASGGAKSEEVMKTLGAVHAKGIGSKMTPINTYLSVLGFEPGNVYKNDRDATGSRMWIPGEQFEEALRKVSAQTADDPEDLL